MIEPKPFASLSSSLLARKGMARPAMRPQVFSAYNTTREPHNLDDLGWDDMGPASASLPEEPMACTAGEHVPSSIAALTPMAPIAGHDEDTDSSTSVIAQQREAIEAGFAVSVGDTDDDANLEAEIGAEAEAEAEAGDKVCQKQDELHTRPSQIVRLPSTKAKSGTETKVAFTLRLEHDRHLKLRLACAVSGRSAQQLLTEALDQLLQSKPEVAALASQVSAQAKKA